jgi:4-hydroxybenzoate polyprenyltransferase
MLGLKSSALRLGARTRPWLAAFYCGAVVLWGVAAGLAGASAVFACFLVAIAIQLSWQTLTLDIDDWRNCLDRFRSNRWVGWLLFGGLTADMAWRALGS